MIIFDAKGIGKTVRSFRKAQNLTQEQLAAQGGTGVRFLRELENGKPSCHLDKTLKILAMLGLEVGISPRGNNE